MGFVMDSVSSDTQTSDFSDMDPENKLLLNGLSGKVRDLLT